MNEGLEIFMWVIMFAVIPIFTFSFGTTYYQTYLNNSGHLQEAVCKVNCTSTPYLSTDQNGWYQVAQYQLGNCTRTTSQTKYGIEPICASIESCYYLDTDLCGTLTLDESDLVVTWKFILLFAVGTISFTVATVGCSMFIYKIFRKYKTELKDAV